jgi:hypothetical protein
MLKRKDNITVTQIMLTSVYWIQRSTGSSGEMQTRLMHLGEFLDQLSDYELLKDTAWCTYDCHVVGILIPRYKFLRRGTLMYKQKYSKPTCRLYREVCVCMYASCVQSVITSGSRIICRSFSETFGLLSFLK